MAEAYVSRLGELAIKAEGTKGTKSLPAVDGSESKIRVLDLAWSVEQRRAERTPFAKSLSAYPSLIGQEIGVISGRIELRKSATTNTEDAWGPLLRAAGLAFASGVYTMTTDQSAHPTLTALGWFSSSGASAASIRRGIRGAMLRSARLVFDVGAQPFLEFELAGAYDASDTDLVEQADALNTITHETAIPGVFRGATNLQLDDSNVTLYLSSFALDFGPNTVERQDAASTNGIAHMAVVDRALRVTLDPERAAPSVAYWRGKQTSGATVKFEITHTQPATTTPSHGAATFAFVFPACQVVDVVDGDRNGIATVTATLTPCLSAEPGDDEFSLTITKSS